MTRVEWHCHECFHGMPPEATAGGIAVVIDVLRASTTIITALSHGARAVKTVCTPEEARRLAAAAGEAACLLGGERGGLRIEGFDLGNSPREYSRERIGGRRIVTTTTNGTLAVDACSDAAAILIGALLNRRAVAAEAVARAVAGGGASRRIHLVCAGTDGLVSEEDILGAGAILDAAGPLHSLDAAAGRALEAFRDVIGDAPPGDAGEGVFTALERAMMASRGGKNLLAIGMGTDLASAAQIDSLRVVPVLDVGSGWFTAG